uniref:NADH dehydrogenase subunit 1 n=1 Tax=Chrysopetalum debile TaxID=115833 RepID=UPI001EDE1B38|nr:NADH dehydrogenase subunit 1 [Chrysopetalum debile]UJV31475.1 NADH dehydrogenase subunit 1 [Chrysopetalum debile]
MMLSPTLTIIITYICLLLAMAFFTLLERKALGYIQNRKGPNKVGLAGLPQPIADALKLFNKEMNKPTMSNSYPFLFAPFMGLMLALILCTLFPHSSSMHFILFGVLMFLCISSINVYTTLVAGWASNSKYSLLGALRSVAQTISYEVSMSLILMSTLIIYCSLDLMDIVFNNQAPLIAMFIPLFLVWFTTTLAETNRTPFDFAEGESELVSGFNTEYSSGAFALIFMAEYTNIIIMSLLSSVLFFGVPLEMSFLQDFLLVSITMLLAFSFLWIRGTLPRLRYDRLMYLTWKTFLPLSLALLMLVCTLSIL